MAERALPKWETVQGMAVMNALNKVVYTDDAVGGEMCIEKFLNSAERNPNECIKHFPPITLVTFDDLVRSSSSAPRHGEVSREPFVLRDYGRTGEQCRL